MIQPDKLHTCRLFCDYVWILGSGHLCFCVAMLSESWDNNGQGSRFQRDKPHVLIQFIAHKLYFLVTVFMFISSLFVRVSQDFPTSLLPFSHYFLFSLQFLPHHHFISPNKFHWALLALCQSLSKVWTDLSCFFFHFLLFDICPHYLSLFLL